MATSNPRSEEAAEDSAEEARHDPASTGRNADPVVGDLVVCRDPEWREVMHLPDELGIVVDVRKDQGKIFYPSLFGEAWIPNHSLARIRNPATAKSVPDWMQRIWFLAKSLDSIALQIERYGKEGNAVRLFHREIEVETIDRLREGMGEELRYYAISPAGLHKMEANIAFVTVSREDPPLPPATPTEDLPS